MIFLKPTEYQKGCIKKFQIYKQKILKLIPDARVEHIGASSIDGAISKGDLDIFIGVNEESFDMTIETLKDLQFREKQGTLRTNELCMMESNNNEDTSFQVVVNGSEFEFFLDFRDKMNNSKELLKKYNKLKMKFQGRSQIEYRKRKSEFIEEVLRKN